MKKINVLEYHTDIWEQTVAGQLPDIHVPDGNGTAVYIVKAGQQAAHCGFTASRGAYNSCGCFFGNIKADIFQNRPAVITKAHIIKGDIKVIRLFILSVFINKFCLFNFVQLFKRRFNQLHGMGRIVNLLDMRKNHKGENRKH